VDLRTQCTLLKYALGDFFLFLFLATVGLVPFSGAVRLMPIIPFAYSLPKKQAVLEVLNGRSVRCNLAGLCGRWLLSGWV